MSEHMHYGMGAGGANCVENLEHENTPQKILLVRPPMTIEVMKVVPAVM